jgi:hypothetical protein
LNRGDAERNKNRSQEFLVDVDVVLELDSLPISAVRFLLLGAGIGAAGTGVYSSSNGPRVS